MNKRASFVLLPVAFALPLAHAVGAGMRGPVDARFRQMDVDGSGWIERAELRRGRGPGYAAIFEQADANRDGRLDPDEFIKAEAMHDRQRLAGWVGDSVITARVKAALVRELDAPGVGGDHHTGPGAAFRRARQCRAMPARRAHRLGGFRCACRAQRHHGALSTVPSPKTSAITSAIVANPERKIMNQSLQQHPRMSPLAAGAAVSVIVFSMVGVAAVTGLIPVANSQREDAAHEAVAARAPVGNASAPAGSHAPTPRPVAGSAAHAPQAPARGSASACSNCGTVESVRTVELKGDASGLGAVAGGVTGAVIGNQMGSGRGNTAMTVIGAAGGAFAGNEIEKNIKKRHVYRVTVRMEDGSYRTLSQSEPPAVGAGARVRIQDGALIARS